MTGKCRLPICCVYGLNAGDTQENDYSSEGCESHFMFRMLPSRFYLWLMEYLLKVIKVKTIWDALSTQD